MTQEIISADDIHSMIHTIRGVQVMLDSDLAAIYGYEVRSFNQQVRRNINRFPSDFMFELTKEEVNLVKSQNVISRRENFFSGQEGGRRKAPLAFSEQGIYMLASVLRGELADRQSFFIMKAFKSMRQLLNDNALVFQRLDRMETRQLEADHRIDMLYNLLDEPKLDKAVIFFKGVLFPENLLLKPECFRQKNSIGV